MLTNPVKRGGIVIFVPSKHILTLIKQSSKVANLRRPVYFEDEIEIGIFKSNPQILFAIMGGKLSEGINFSDDACRLLIILGMPYPTITLELEERARSDKEYCTNVAMKTVNQSIGRAIRHKDDFAAIVLMDSRFITHRQKLSPWIKDHTLRALPVKALLEINTFLKKNKLYE